MKLTVISPTLNEGRKCPQLVEQLGRALGDIDYEILIVDDDSATRPGPSRRKISATNPECASFAECRTGAWGWP